MNDWSDRRWSDLATLEYGKGIRDYADASGEFPVYGTNGQIGWHNQALWHAPGVVIGRKGAYRGVHYSGRPFFVIDTAFYLKPKIDFDMRWAYYQLLTQDINGLDSGSAIPSTSRDDFYRLDVRVPPLSIQRRIAEILGRLDDKIEVNRRINRTLGRMAQALYKHWFVDFGPFQDGEFVESEVGLVPRRWEVKKVEDLLELAYGKGLTERNRIPGPYPVIGSSGVVGYHAQPMVSGPGIVVGRKGTIGRVTWVTNDFWPIDTTYYVVPNRQDHGLEFLFHLLGGLDLSSRNSDSAVPGLNRNEVYRLPVVVPPDELLMKFGQIANHWFDLIHKRNGENAKLAATRDYLLPRLLAGEVEV